jgi:hypothetical protein
MQILNITTDQHIPPILSAPEIRGCVVGYIGFGSLQKIEIHSNFRLKCDQGNVGVVKSTLSHPEIFTISLLQYNYFCMSHYNLLSGPPMPILRAREAHDAAVDANVILKGWGVTPTLGNTTRKYRQF